MTFFTKEGLEVPGVTGRVHDEALAALYDRFFVSPVQVSEAASYSMAMVVRYALGLSAEGGAVTVIAADSLAGEIALATTRHLVHGGAAAAVYVSGETGAAGVAGGPDGFGRARRALEALGLPVITYDPGGVPESLGESLSRSHNVLLGLHGGRASPAAALVDELNDSPAPVHVVSVPPGVDADSGKPGKTPLFASSTLSLGLPYAGLSPARDFVGRHYVCDVSFPPEVFIDHGVDLPRLFPDQPLRQLLFEPPT